MRRRDGSVAGSAFYYNRDKALAATSWRANLIGAEKEDLAWHQGGATMGGPLARNRAFYFGSYESFRRNFSNTFLTNVPTEAQRNGVFATTVRDPRTARRLPTIRSRATAGTRSAPGCSPSIRRPTCRAAAPRAAG